MPGSSFPSCHLLSGPRGCEQLCSATHWCQADLSVSSRTHRQQGQLSTEYNIWSAPKRNPSFKILLDTCSDIMLTNTKNYIWVESSSSQSEVYSPGVAESKAHNHLKTSFTFAESDPLFPNGLQSIIHTVHQALPASTEN